MYDYCSIINCQEVHLVAFILLLYNIYKQQKKSKKELSHSRTYTMLCMKTLILACVYVGFFPVINNAIFNQFDPNYIIVHFLIMQKSHI